MNSFVCNRGGTVQGVILIQQNTFSVLSLGVIGVILDKYAKYSNMQISL